MSPEHVSGDHDVRTFSVHLLSTLAELEKLILAGDAIAEDHAEKIFRAFFAAGVSPEKSAAAEEIGSGMFEAWMRGMVAFGLTADGELGFYAPTVQ
jgi:hypothetical protein